MSNDNDGEGGGLLRRVVRKVAGPAKDLIQKVEDSRLSQFADSDRAELKAMIERKRRNEPEPAAPVANVSALRTPANTANLVGQRVEPALERLDGFIDGLLRSGEPVGFVLHGHGTGALRNAVRAHLAQHPCVTRAEPADREDGGDAFTVLWLR